MKRVTPPHSFHPAQASSLLQLERTPWLPAIRSFMMPLALRSYRKAYFLFSIRMSLSQVYLASLTRYLAA